MGFISGGRYYSSGRSWADEQRSSSRTTSNPASSSVEQLAAEGNTAAQEYLNTGGLNPNQNVTDSAGNPLSAQDITGMVAGGYLPRTGGSGVYNVSSGSQAKAQKLYSSAYGGTGGVTDGGGTNGGYSVLGGGSDGSNFGSAGGGWNPGGSTRFDSAGNVIIGTTGSGRNIIRGATDVDRTAALNNASNPYAMFTDPNYFINRSEDIRKQVERQMQGTIDAINARYEGQVRREEEAGAQDLARQRSMNLRAGLGGSDFGAANKAEVRNRTNANIKDIQAQQDIAVGNAILQIEQIAQNRITTEQNAMQNAFSNTLAVKGLEMQMQKEAKETIKELGAAGLDMATIKERDPSLYNSITTAAGIGEVQAEYLMNSAKKAAERIPYEFQVVGNTIIGIGQDPITGELKQVKQELLVDVPKNYSVSFAPDGTMMMVPDEFDPTIPVEDQVIFGGNYAKPESGGGFSLSDLKAMRDMEGADRQDYMRSLDTYEGAQFMQNEVNELMAFIDANGGVGWGSLMKMVPEGSSRTVQQRLTTIRANIGFDELVNMRNNSPTGGAVGQLSDRELMNFQAVHGSLDQKQNVDELKRSLTSVGNFYANIGTRAQQDMQWVKTRNAEFGTVVGYGGGNTMNFPEPTPQDHSNEMKMRHPQTNQLVWINKSDLQQALEEGYRYPQEISNPK